MARINFRTDDRTPAARSETPAVLRFANRILYAQQTIPMPPVIVPVELYIWVSFYQGNWDAAVAKAAGAKAAGIRVVQGYSEDPRFEPNVQSAVAADLPFYVTAVLDPSRGGPESTADFFLELIDGKPYQFISLDCEKTGGLSKYSLLDYIIRFYERVAEHTDCDIEIYTRMSWWNYYVAPSNFWRANGVKLEAARYHLGLSTPWSDGKYTPRDWDYALNEFWEWQYSADGNHMGPIFGAESDSICLGLRAGTFTQLPGLEEQVAENTRQIALIWDWINQHELNPLLALPYYEAKVTGEKAVAFAISQFNTKKRPVINVNAHTATGDPALRWEKNEYLKVYPVEITADGSKTWYVLYDVPLHDFTILFVDPNDLEFVVR